MPTLDFKGKQHIYAHHLAVPYRPLVADPSRSVMLSADACSTPPPPPPPRSLNRSSGVEPISPVADGNLIIHGDNLHALKALLPRYAGRVDCIYIDPPYNTGNEGWTYNDNVNSPLMREWLKANVPVDGEDLERHDKWLCMMWPRLQLHKELLADDGAIFVSIDDNEQHHLRMLMDEIFGADNFVANIIWQHRHGRSNNAKLFSNQREHVLLYRKSDKLSHIRVRRDEKLDGAYENPDNDPRGSWASSSYVNPAPKERRPNLVYPIVNPHTGARVNHPTRAWKYSYETHSRHVGDDRLWWGKNHNLKYPRLKNFLSESEEKGIVPIDLMLADAAGTTDEGTRQLQSVFQDESVAFNNPKPTRLVRNLIAIAEGAKSDKDTVILDSFAGSGTTAHAVLALNKEDGGNRRFILVECEDYADSITAERVRRAIKGVPGARDESLREGLGGSFAYCELGDPIDEEGMLTAESPPSRSALAAYLLHVSSGVSADGAGFADDADGDGLFYRGETTDYYLLYRPDREWLRGGEGMLSEARARRIAEAIKPSGRKAVVFAPGKYIGQRELTRMGITFCQLPYEIYRAPS